MFVIRALKIRKILPLLAAYRPTDTNTAAARSEWSLIHTRSIGSRIQQWTLTGLLPRPRAATLPGRGSWPGETGGTGVPCLHDADIILLIVPQPRGAEERGAWGVSGWGSNPQNVNSSRRIRHRHSSKNSKRWFTSSSFLFLSSNPRLNNRDLQRET